MILILTVNMLVLFVSFGILWRVAEKHRNVGIVDIAWGLGFVLVTWISWAGSDAYSARKMWIAVLVSIWGLRLAAYLLWRNWGKPEDHRYAKMRAKHGAKFGIFSLMSVFLLQALLIWIVSLPIQIGLAGHDWWVFPFFLGLLLWLVGFGFETIGDYQLAKFKAQPVNRGQLFDRGLWRFTRHPNYFGDFLVWWGLFLVSATANSWWWTVAGPIVMSILLIRVSGVRLLESSLRHRIDGYDDYLKSTSPFFPLPPRKTDRCRV